MFMFNFQRSLPVPIPIGIKPPISDIQRFTGIFQKSCACVFKRLSMEVSYFLIEKHLMDLKPLSDNFV